MKQVRRRANGVISVRGVHTLRLQVALPSSYAPSAREASTPPGGGRPPLPCAATAFQERIRICWGRTPIRTAFLAHEASTRRYPLPRPSRIVSTVRRVCIQVLWGQVGIQSVSPARQERGRTPSVPRLWRSAFGVCLARTRPISKRLRLKLVKIALRASIRRSPKCRTIPASPVQLANFRTRLLLAMRASASHALPAPTLRYRA